MNSLDPRVNRLPAVGEPGNFASPVPLDQFTTFEVFVQSKNDKPFQHEGIVHAPNLDMAFILAKETFTRRFTCVSMYVVNTGHVATTSVSEANQNAYDLIDEALSGEGITEQYEIYHLLKRGKQQLHVGTVNAVNPEQAFAKAKEKFNSGKSVHSIWAIRTGDILFTTQEEADDLWLTLPEKKFRDAAEYKGGEKLKNFLESRSKNGSMP